MLPDDLAKQSERYQHALQTHGATPKALRWKDYPSIARRYAELVADVDISHKHILDIGCGMGDLLPYLHARGTDFTYLGVDVIPEFVQIARERYSGHEFTVWNPLAQDLPGSFDIVVSSGTMNSASPGWLENRKSTITRLFAYANEAVVFNMAGGLQPSSVGKTIAYADSREVFDFCATLTPKLILRNHYSSKDFTIVMFK